MLISEEVEVTVNYKNIKRYKHYNYEFPTFINEKGSLSVKRGTKIKVRIEHLDIKSGANIVYVCDYCGEKVNVRYCDYMKHYQEGIKIDKDCCKSCIGEKTKENMVNKYGVTSPFSLKEVREKSSKTVKDRYGVNNVFQLQSVKDKSREATMEKYGVEWYVQTDEYTERYKKTCIDRYGYDNVSKSPDIIQKIKDVQFERYGGFYTKTDEFKAKYKSTCFDKYGVENLFQADFVKNKIIKYNYDKYGVSHPMKIPSIKNDRIRKMIFTKYRNGNGQSSRQQDYLHTIFGGEINYPVDRCCLDIALVANKIYCEYDGSGHELSVLMGSTTKSEFDKKEMGRKFYLRSKGWREFRIISNKDLIPSVNVLIDMKNISEEWFSKHHYWIKFDIDNNTIENSEGIYVYNY